MVYIYMYGSIIDLYGMSAVENLVFILLYYQVAA